MAELVKATITITFETDPKPPASFSKEMELRNLRDPGGDEFVAQSLFWELDRMSLWGAYYEALPNIDQFSVELRQSFRAEELFQDVYENRINTWAMWFEIGKTLRRTKHLFAWARAYHEVQTRIRPEQQPIEDAKWHLHLKQMDDFDFGVVLLAKVGDLALRLIFERLGPSLIPSLNQDEEDWERNLTLKTMKKAFANLASNPGVAPLKDQECEAVRAILDEFGRPDFVRKTWRYRCQLVHRITPSVDEPRLYTELEDRKWTSVPDPAGREKGKVKQIGVESSSAEYCFLDLYGDAKRTFEHYVAMLNRLRNIPRFGPEAIDT